MVIHSRRYRQYYFRYKNGIYYFRVITPIELRRRCPKIAKEVRCSLKTRTENSAKRKAARLYLEVISKIENAIESLETVDEVLSYIPALISLESNLPDAYKNELNLLFNQVITEHRGLLESRYLEDISDKERSILKGFGKAIDIISQMKFDPSDTEDYTADLAIFHSPILSGMKDVICTT